MLIALHTKSTGLLEMKNRKGAPTVGLSTTPTQTDYSSETSLGLDQLKKEGMP